MTQTSAGFSIAAMIRAAGDRLHELLRFSQKTRGQRTSEDKLLPGLSDVDEVDTLCEERLFSSTVCDEDLAGKRTSARRFQM